MNRIAPLLLGCATMSGAAPASASAFSIEQALSAPGASQDQMRLAFESSTLATMGTWRSPVLLIHADDFLDRHLYRLAPKEP